MSVVDRLACHHGVVTEGHTEKDGFTVLHTLRCIGFASVERLASVAGLPTAAVSSALDELVASEAVQGSPLGGGWGLTETGRSVDRALVAAELAAASAQDTVVAEFERFLDLNPRLLSVCTDWQMRLVGGTVLGNDHRDQEYDAAVLDRLLRIHEAIEPVLVSVGEPVPRFRRYGRRLEDAVERILSGRADAVADDLDSYHSVWFQLHEDFLATLGRTRFG